MGNDEFDLILEDKAVGGSDALIEIIIGTVANSLDFISVITDFEAALGIVHIGEEHLPPHDLIAQGGGKVSKQTYF